MGKKSKANRQKAPAAAAAATTTTTTTTDAAVVTTTATIPAAASAAVFPESTFFIKAETFRRKGNLSKAKKIYLQGIENGCVRCLNEYTSKILNDGATIENKMVAELFTDNIHLHLVLPLLLEGAIRGNHDAMLQVCRAYSVVSYDYEEKNVSRVGHSLPATPLVLYWSKHVSKNFDREDRTQAKKKDKEEKERIGTECSVCEKEDSETVTLRKCDGCKFYYYCSKECQQKMWREGQHAGVCRHLGLLNKYHKPFAKKIWKDIVVHGIAPQDIPELQELRQRLGLSRPQEDYQDQLEEVQALRLDSAQLILPRKDGTVQIGSFPRPI